MTVVVVSLAAGSAHTQTQATKPDYPVQPVPFTRVHVNDVFWAPRIETNRTASIPAAFEQCELTGRVDNFVRAAKALRGEHFENKANPPYPFDDTDLYKVATSRASSRPCRDTSTPNVARRQLRGLSCS